MTYGAVVAAAAAAGSQSKEAMQMLQISDTKWMNGSGGW